MAEGCPLFGDVVDPICRCAVILEGGEVMDVDIPHTEADAYCGAYNKCFHGEACQVWCCCKKAGAIVMLAGILTLCSTNFRIEKNKPSRPELFCAIP